jgi:hypothetical protein
MVAPGEDADRPPTPLSAGSDKASPGILDVEAVT